MYLYVGKILKGIIQTILYNTPLYMTMETLAREVPSSMHHHSNSSVSNMKHSYVQVLIEIIICLNNICIVLLYKMIFKYY